MLRDGVKIMADKPKMSVPPLTNAMMGTLDKGIELGEKGYKAGKELASKAIEATTIDVPKWKEWASKKMAPKPVAPKE